MHGEDHSRFIPAPLLNCSTELECVHPSPWRVLHRVILAGAEEVVCKSTWFRPVSHGPRCRLPVRTFFLELPPHVCGSLHLLIRLCAGGTVGHLLSRLCAEGTVGHRLLSGLSGRYFLGRLFSGVAVDIANRKREGRAARALRRREG